MTEPERILIVDDDLQMAMTLADILRSKGFEAEVAHSGLQALEHLQKVKFTCVISDIRMPECDGVELFRKIKTAQDEIPVVLMTAYASDEIVQLGLDEGVIAALIKPLDIDRLLNFLYALQKDCTVAIIDDDPNFSEILREVLEGHQFNVIQATDSLTLEADLRSNSQVVLLLDMRLKGTSGLDELLKIIRVSSYLPVILMTAFEGEMAVEIEEAITLGAQTCLFKPIKTKSLLTAIREAQLRDFRRRLGFIG